MVLGDDLAGLTLRRSFNISPIITTSAVLSSMAVHESFDALRVPNFMPPPNATCGCMTRIGRERASAMARIPIVSYPTIYTHIQASRAHDKPKLHLVQLLWPQYQRAAQNTKFPRRLLCLCIRAKVKES